MGAELLIGLPAKIKKAIVRLTNTRAGYLDNLLRLDTTVTSRATTADATTIKNRLTEERAENIGTLPQVGKFGPITQLYGTEYLYIARYYSDATLLESVSVPVGDVFVEIFNKAGPGVISYMSIDLNVVSSPRPVYEVEIDGVVVYAAALPNYSAIRGEAFIGSLTGTTNGVALPLTLATLFHTSFIVRAKHNASSAWTINTRFLGFKL